MLADSKLPTTFWAEAVNTACYVQNRVLVIKPHNKTPYELFLGRKPALSFMRPFGCPVTILNTLDHLGNQTNGNAGTKANIDEGQGGMKTVPGPHYVLLPFLTSDSQSPKSSENEVADDVGVLDPAKEDNKSGQVEATNTNNTNILNTVSLSINTVSSSFTTMDPGRERVQRNEFESVFGQDNNAKGNSIYRMFTPVNAARSSCDNLSGSVPVNAATLPNADLPTNHLMPDLKDTGIFSGAYDDEDVGAEADLNNLETTMNVSPIPTTRIYKDHPKNQIIRDINSATQTRRMTKISEEYAMEPKKKVWRLVDLPKGKHAIGTKWVSRNKKDKRGIVVRNKARLVAQGYTQEEGVDYKVFVVVARIEAIRLFLDYASFIGFIVYQMDVKSPFLYGTIEEEVYVCQPPGFEDPQFPDKVYKVEKALYGLHQAPKAYDYAGASLDRKSTTGGCQFLGKRLISWQCKKQTIVANSTTEAEYVAATNCWGHVLWIKNQMLDYGFNFMNTKIYIDNESTICIVKNPVFHSKTKHIETRHHFIRDFYVKKLIQMIKINTDQNVEDLLTKAFDVSRKAKRTTKISQSSGPIPLITDEIVIKEWEDRMERAATTASSLEAKQDSGEDLPIYAYEIKLQGSHVANLPSHEDPSTDLESSFHSSSIFFSLR
ncbi:putative ribonuclease H-like domain-containing protein [Tanacetum coccineum]